ncbi:BnaC04g55900D [Brassica napus]|uniref:BnaC04g55900D protein n=3 Tax=Brassica TaxID=3705 RepID=A0A078J7A9_BRANA|nr:BnaC04g55900D [Brassica napus]VDD10906.1 unnamed protein product [Brassica oleracea]
MFRYLFLIKEVTSFMPSISLQFFSHSSSLACNFFYLLLGFLLSLSWHHGPFCFQKIHTKKKRILHIFSFTTVLGILTIT